MNTKELICPISAERVNERVARCNALLTVLLVTSAIYFKSPLIMLLLVADFFVRAFTSLKTSPLNFISTNMVQIMGLDLKPIDKAPKIFAARLGFLMSFIILVFTLTGSFTASFIVAGILSLFAFLEFAFGFCAGCVIYTYLVLPLTRGNES